MTFNFQLAFLELEEEGKFTPELKGDPKPENGLISKF